MSNDDISPCNRINLVVAQLLLTSRCRALPHTAKLDGTVISVFHRVAGVGPLPYPGIAFRLGPIALQIVHDLIEANVAILRLGFSPVAIDGLVRLERVAGSIIRT